MASIRTRTLTLLSTFILTPRELACALDITTMHASTVLNRLWRDGHCWRWPHYARSYRYMQAHDA